MDVGGNSRKEPGIDYHLDFLPYIWSKLSEKLTKNLRYQKSKTTIYAKRNKAPIPRHLEYKDDVDFICESLEKAQETVQIATKDLEKFNFKVNQSKT